MKTRKTETRFMSGNIDLEGEVMDILLENYSREEVYSSMFFEDDIVFSDGFVSAIENGKVPQLDKIYESFEGKIGEEYHHFVLNDKCYVVYFK